MKMHGCGRQWRERAQEFRAHGRHGGGWGRFRGRLFDQGDLRLIILKLLEEKPRHGYDIIKAIEESLGGAYAPSPGVVYPTLTLLEDLGYAAMTAEEGGKKLYALTDSGRAYLAENADAVAGVTRRLEAARARFGGGPPAPIVRAMENLRYALRLRVERGGLTPERIAEIAALLDAAAQNVEQT